MGEMGQMDQEFPSIMDPSPPNIGALSGLSTSERSSSARGPGGKQITRNRVSYSCHTCRRRKVKCDKVHPICSNCAKTGADCVYDTASQKRDDERDEAGHSNQGVKRRRETPRTWGEDVDELQSIYGHLRQTESPAGQKPDSRAIEHRLDKLMSMIERINGSSSALEAAEKHTAAPTAAVESALLEELRRAHARNGRTTSPRPSSPRRAAAESSGDEFPIPSGQATDLVDPIGSLNLGHLSLEDGGRSRYVGTTYWAYISHEINDLNQLLRDQNRSHDLASSDMANDDSNDPTSSGRRAWKESVSSPNYSTSSRSRGESLPKPGIFPSGDSPSGVERVVEPEMLEHVPSRRQSHILYKGFMSGVHAISPVVHPPSVLKLYNAFWDWYDYSSYSGEPCPSPTFIPLLYAIWYGGSVTISLRTIKAEFNSVSRFALSSLYNEEVTRWLTRISFPRSPSLQGLSAYLIVQTILSKEEEPLTSSLFVSLAMRVAQTMGLHRDPAKFGIEPCEAEYRRRLWWHIMHMDGVVAMSSGLPPLVSDENYWDVRETSEIKDTMLGSPAAERYEQLIATNQRLPDDPDDPSVCGGSSMVNVFYLTARGKYIMARAVRRILRIQLGTKPVTRRDMEELRAILLDLQLKLNSIVNRIPKGMLNQTPGRAMSMSKSPVEVQSTETELPGEGTGGCTEQYHSPVLVSFHKWARIILSLYIDKAFCVAYQPFLKNARSRIWPNARQSALRHCHGFMGKFIQLATDPDFQPFHWSWPGNHQPMHATMIMLIDLYERPYSPEASKSRAFIDRILALSGPDGGVVGGEDGISTQRPLKDGGREAWDMIRRLRQKAWQKAGLNPQMLWTEQDQIQAGLASPAGEPPSLRGSFPSGSAPGSPAASSARQDTAGSDRQLNDFNRMFYNMTRSQLATIKPSPLRYSYQPPARTSRSQLTTQYNSNPPAATMQSNLPSPSAISSSPVVSPSLSTPSPSASSTVAASRTQTQLSHVPQPLSNPNPSPHVSFMDPMSPNPHSMGVPTPPSMVDPNLNFDWDQWDAVFGQHLPVSDELMELDPVSGLEFTNLGIPTLHSGNSGNIVNTTTDMASGGLPSPWANRASPSDSSWTGYC
ncbi:transcriptional regulator family: Fungal Specific TF [Penicillium malachiteum]|uniref:Transcriptional regulator family: Fungal Specific TF n=1 Tax=Penicillium malachiteum TaxID=1324776 RepID=A0AAD6MR47_9EURO|nr:transcriptional regulator family: Fungal Specific TF [Penicillium malachiteum]